MKYFSSWDFPFFPSPGLFIIEPGDEIVKISMIARNFRNHWGDLIRERKISRIAVVSPDGKWGHIKDGKVQYQKEATFEASVVSSIDVYRVMGPQKKEYGDPGDKVEIYSFGDTNWGQTFYVSPKALEQSGLPVPKSIHYGNVMPELMAFTLPEPKQTLWGYIYVDPNEEQVLQETFEYATRFNEYGVAVVKKKNAPYNSGWGIINTLGKWVVEPIYSRVQIENGKVLVKRGFTEVEELVDLNKELLW